MDLLKLGNNRKVELATTKPALCGLLGFFLEQCNECIRTRISERSPPVATPVLCPLIGAVAGAREACSMPSKMLNKKWIAVSARKGAIAMHLDTDKLLENALTSIRLGVEDFQRSQLPEENGGDPARALSAVRNLFAGVLLLFKHKIASSVDDPEDAHSLIHNPPEILPHSDGAGGVIWKPSGRFKPTTIDVATIKKRFQTFGITVDWQALDRLQDCRNHLEHLHPANTLGEVADFVAELFPVLRDFIETQLDAQPADLLGSAWPIMLDHHAFFVATRDDCQAAWEPAQIPRGMLRWLNRCQCEECGSPLMRPCQEDLDDGLMVEDDEFRYMCVACGHSDRIVPLMLGELDHELNDYNPFDGEEPLVEECDQCGHPAFIVHEGECDWCGAELDNPECGVCGEPLRQEDQENGGLCSYHHYQFEKVMRE